MALAVASLWFKDLAHVFFNMLRVPVGRQEVKNQRIGSIVGGLEIDLNKNTLYLLESGIGSYWSNQEEWILIWRNRSG